MISVCMATYNGETRVRKQLVSIIGQLTDEDEIIIVDDCSKDKTTEICRGILKKFNGKSQIIENKNNLGPIKSFERAIVAASGDYIYLSDQDDEWLTNKVAVCQQIFIDQAVDLIVHDAVVLDGNGRVIDSSWNHYNNNNMKQGVPGNLLKNGYTGAMMAFTKRLKNLAIPFPDNVEMHDQWLFLVAKKKRLKIVRLDEPLMNYVRHGDNVTGMKRRSKKRQLIGRWRMLLDYWLK